MLTTLVIIVSLLLVAILLEPVAEKLNIPFSAMLVAVGFAGSEWVVASGIDTGFRWHHFNTLIMELFVPILVFESAFNLHFKLLWRHFLPVLLLAIPAMIVAGLITAVVLFLGINVPWAFSFTTALLAGIICSATDPVAVVALFRKLGAPEELTILLEGESLFNDATAIVLFTLLISLAQSGAEFRLQATLLTFSYTFLGGVLWGVLAGLGALLLQRGLGQPFHRTIIALFAVFFTLFVAEHWLAVSGIVAILCVALILGTAERRRPANDGNFGTTFWGFLAYVSNAIVFLLVGVTITVGMFTSHWLAMLLGIFGALLARWIAIYALVPCVLLPIPGQSLPRNFRPVLWWGGVRGAIALALALSLPQELESWYSVQSIVYGVVLFTLFVQAPLMPWLLKRTL